MGKKFMHKLFAVAMTLALIMTSGAFAFANSPTVGTVAKVNSEAQFSKKTMKVSWKAVKGAEKYKVYLNGKLKKTVTGTSCTLKGLKDGSKYKIQVAAVKSNKAGKKSKVYTKTRTMRWFKVAKKVKAKAGKGKATLTWKKVKGATGYQVCEYKNGTWMVVKSVGKSKTKAVVKNLGKGTHKFRVRPIKGDYLGILCGTKSVKVK